MHKVAAGLLAIAFFIAPANAARLLPSDVVSTDAALRWINAYRVKPDPDGAPALIHALSNLGAFRDPDQSGVYIGFLAGVIGSDPARANIIIGKALSVRSEDRWVVVRAVAYSGLPNWKQTLRNFAVRMPEREAMIDKYVNGKIPTLAELTIKPSPTPYQRFREHMHLGKSKPKTGLEPSPEVLDMLWGYYFATGSYGPIMQIVAMLPWADDHDDVEKLTIGSMAKFTLASNAMRDQTLLAMLKASSKAKDQPKKTVKSLDDITDAAETVEISRIRKQALAAIDELRSKGPAYKRAASLWSYVGQSAIAVGCVAAAATGQVEFGLPCVVGGAASSAALNYMTTKSP